MIRLLYRLIDKLYLECYRLLSSLYLFIVIHTFNLKLGRGHRINGFPKFIVKKRAIVQIGDYFAMNSGPLFNPIGRNQRSLIIVTDDAELRIGQNVGMSSVTIVCQQAVTVGNGVRIGGNTVIYDTDFHSLNADERTALPEIKDNIRRKPVLIGNNVFIGGHSTILKGTEIGDNSIIGAGSVVRGEIPKNEIWAGNPARFVKKIEDKK